MSFLRWLNCWIFSHEAHNNEILIVKIFEDDMNVFDPVGQELLISICACCNSTIVWDEEKQAWIKW